MVFNPLAIEPLRDSEFRQFQKLIYEWTGISLSEAKKALVAGRLIKRLRYYNINNYGDYLKIVLSKEHPEEKQTMIDLLTTNETYFFREERHFAYLREKILPKHKGFFRAWSAASSSGEEAYSIALVLADVLGLEGWEVFASDISQRMLEEARLGVYPIEEAQHIPEHLLKKFCLKGINSQEGRFTIIREIKKNVHFEQINLVESLPSHLGLFDVIFLRNVMIYFNQETKKDIVERIAEHLKPEGFLIVGHAETLLGVTKKLKPVEPTIYKKA
ncbi:MAG: protein-glutamate O-methyltransferase CheR [Leptospiraceae bacterium]|nr:protein-glutamate O-methyltransferase CheR [Leptospiraceae bacterium]MDW8306937.1 protein-glutamate O-methyltransferase CheR [Leptospiraceae bacterium]